MKNNFTNEEKITIFNTLGNKLYVRINRAGNIEVINPKRTNENERFVLYFTPNKRYLWRRWFDKFYCHPLNMKNRKRTGEVIHGEWNGKKFSWYHREWNIINCEFDTVNEALDYFVNYMKKYHNVNL